MSNPISSAVFPARGASRRRNTPTSRVLITPPKSKTTAPIGVLPSGGVTRSSLILDRPDDLAGPGVRDRPDLPLDEQLLETRVSRCLPGLEQEHRPVQL